MGINHVYFFKYPGGISDALMRNPDRQVLKLMEILLQFNLLWKEAFVDCFDVTYHDARMYVNKQVMQNRKKNIKEPLSPSLFGNTV